MIEASVDTAQSKERGRAAACVLLSVLVHVALLMGMPLSKTTTPAEVTERQAPVTVRLIHRIEPVMPRAPLAPAGVSDAPPVAITSAPAPPPRPAVSAAPPRRPPAIPTESGATAATPALGARPRIDLEEARATARASESIPDPRPSMRNLAPTQTDAPIARGRVEAAIARATAAPEPVERQAADGSWTVQTGNRRCQMTPGTRPAALEGTLYVTQCDVAKH